MDGVRYRKQQCAESPLHSCSSSIRSLAFVCRAKDHELHTHLTAPSDTFLADRCTAQTKQRCALPASNSSTGCTCRAWARRSSGLHLWQIWLHVHVSFPQKQWSRQGAWSLVSSPHVTRKCRLLPGAQDRGLNVCDSDASTFPSSPSPSTSARHMARVGEARLCCIEAAPRCIGCAVGGHGSGGR